MSDLNTAAGLVELPEGVMPTYGIVIVSYIDSEGEEKFSYQTLGDPTFSTVAGQMMMVSHDLFHLANSTDDV